MSGSPSPPPLLAESVLAYRDRAILKFFLYSPVARISTACRPKGLRLPPGEPRGNHPNPREGRQAPHIGLHAEAAQAIAEYIRKAELTRSPLFRPRLNPRSQKLGSGANGSD
jgi:hypothetical protein